MKILRNYILKDFLLSFLFSLVAITAVMTLGNMIEMLDMIIRKGFFILDAFKILFFHLLALLGIIVPPSLLMATLLSIGRLLADNELVAINVAGISLMKIMSIFLIIGVICSLGLFILNDNILANFHYTYRINKHISPKDITALIEPGVIYSENLKGITLYIEDKKDKLLKDVYISENNEEGFNQLVYAKTGEFIVENDTLKMKLVDGTRDVVNANKLTQLNFKVLFYNIPLKEALANQPETKIIDKKPKDMGITEIKEKIAYLKEHKINSIKFRTELHKRINLSFSPIGFILLGFGISLIVKHREKSINFLTAFAGTAFYYIFLILGTTLSKAEILDPIIGMAMPNILILFIGGFLFMKNAYTR